MSHGLSSNYRVLGSRAFVCLTFLMRLGGNSMPREKYTYFIRYTINLYAILVIFILNFWAGAGNAEEMIELEDGDSAKQMITTCMLLNISKITREFYLEYGYQMEGEVWVKNVYTTLGASKGCLTKEDFVRDSFRDEYGAPIMHKKLSDDEALVYSTNVFSLNGKLNGLRLFKDSISSIDIKGE